MLSYDTRNMGQSKSVLVTLNKPLKEACKKMNALRSEQGFFDLPMTTSAKELVCLAKTLQEEGMQTLLVLGIGGSDLGGRSLIQALDKGKGMRVIFLSNPDPRTTTDVFAALDWKSTAITVISKSGSTLETLSLFLTAKQYLSKAVGPTKTKEKIIAITDQKNGPLFHIAKKEGFRLIPHPINVGGRFSVLSAVGLFPAACAGINIQHLLLGAQRVEESARKEGSRHISAQFAARHFQHMSMGRNLHIVMPYADSLSYFALWYRQLWAESLGKDKRAPMPIAALGSVDQHSQIQLYNDGPDNHVVTFITINKWSHNLRIPKGGGGEPELAYLQGKTFAELLCAQQQGTAQALKKSGHPSGTICLETLDEKALGGLIQFFELATVYLAQLLNIDAFNQPGVEEGKRIAKRLLST